MERVIHVMDGKIWPGNASGNPDVFHVFWDGDLGVFRQMRFPLEVKLSTSWNSLWRNYRDDSLQSCEYRQVLSQIQFYMHLFNTKYGGILTEKEMVIVRRTNRIGALEVSQSISYHSHGAFTLQQGENTVPLVLWRMATCEDWFMEGQAVKAANPDDPNSDLVLDEAFSDAAEQRTTGKYEQDNDFIN
jgi:hypothetical protein